MGFFDRASKKVTDTVSIMQKKTSETIASKKLEGQIRNMNGEIDTLCTAIGKRVYAAQIAGATPELDDLFEAIDALNRRIEEARAELDKLNAVRRCENCGEALQMSIRFCPHCGTPVKEPEVVEEENAEDEDTCPECGAKRADNARFCDMCGYDYEGEAEAVVTEVEAIETETAPEQDCAEAEAENGTEETV